MSRIVRTLDRFFSYTAGVTEENVLGVKVGGIFDYSGLFRLRFVVCGVLLFLALVFVRPTLTRQTFSSGEAWAVMLGIVLAGVFGFFAARSVYWRLRVQKLLGGVEDLFDGAEQLRDSLVWNIKIVRRHNPKMAARIEQCLAPQFPGVATRLGMTSHNAARCWVVSPSRFERLLQAWGTPVGWPVRDRID